MARKLDPMGIFTAALGLGFGFLLTPVSPWPLRVGGAIAVVVGSLVLLLAFQAPISKAIERLGALVSRSSRSGQRRVRRSGSEAGLWGKVLGALAGILLGIAIGVVVGVAARPRTEVRYFVPWSINKPAEGLRVVDSLVGRCLYTSAVNVGRTDAWRCFPHNTFPRDTGVPGIYDPCFENPLVPGGDLLCAESPWDPRLTRLSYRGQLPRDFRPNPNFPWALELSDGSRCVFVSGATGVVQAERFNYDCQPSRSFVVGGLDVGDRVWRVKVYYPDDSSAIRFANVLVAWY